MERYRLSDSITNHFTLIYSRDDELKASVGRIFSTMKIPVPWLEVMNANYLIAEMEINNPYGSVLHIKGWIDSIDLASDTEDRPMVEVRWHFDYYEMYKSMINLGYGHVKRRPFRDLASTPVQQYQTIYHKKGGEVYDILKPKYFNDDDSSEGNRIRYVLFSYNILNAQDEVTETRYGCIPVSQNTPMFIDDTVDNDDIMALFPSQIDGNYLSSFFGIRPSVINGIWISDYPPLSNGRPSGKGTITSPFIASGWNSVKHLEGGAYYGYWEAANPIAYATPLVYDFSDDIVSKENEQFSIVGMDGNIAYTLPYDMPIRHVKIRMILQTNACDLECIFYPDGGDSSREQSSIGLRALIPAFEIPVLSNAWSEYAYSEQRAYDIESRQLATDAGAIKSIAAGAGSGAMMGAFGSRGLLVGAIGGSLGGVTSYITETYWQNDKEQELLDRLKANQSPMLLLSGYSCTDIIWNGSFTKLQEFVFDDYSDSQLQNMRSNFGISVDEILSSCDSLVRSDLTTGYYSIKNLIISGDAPKEAKDYIKNKFSSGVKLI